MKAITKGIWVWTAKAEAMAKELSLDTRTENTPARLGYGLLGQYASKSWVELGYVKEDSTTENLINSNIPKGSKITGTSIKSLFGSTFLEIHHTVTEEYQTEYGLTYTKRILHIRLIKGEHDEGLPVTSFADSQAS